MKKDIADLWIKALRSGDYEQGQGGLKSRAGEYCCLGVLCALAPAEVGKFAPSMSSDCDDVFVDSNSIREASYAPRSVREWAGLHTKEGDLPEDKSLAEQNDDGATFDEIADIIEKNWKVL